MAVETAYDPQRPPGAVLVQRDGLPVVGHYADAYHLTFGDQDVMVAYLLEVRRAN